MIRVGDVAHVHDGYQPQQNVVRLDGVRGVLLTILKSGSASTLSVVDGVKKAMPRNSEPACHPSWKQRNSPTNRFLYERQSTEW